MSYLTLASITSDLIWPFLRPYKGVIPDKKWPSFGDLGAQFEGNLGKILAPGAEILPYIGLREKWESP